MIDVVYLQLNNSNSNNNNLIIESNKFRCDYSEKICENENLEEEINTLKIINKKLIDRINYFDNQTFSINSFNKNNFEEIQKMKKEIKDIKEQIKKLENDIKNNRSIIILFNGKSNELKIELENFKNKNELVGKGFEYLMKQFASESGLPHIRCFQQDIRCGRCSSKSSSIYCHPQ